MRKSEKNAISEIGLVFFCGNPGREYSLTRHNAAWLLLEAFSRGKTLSWQKKFKGVFTRVETAAPGSGTVFLKPDLFMNMAGESLAPAASFFRLNPGNILVCHDDIELEYGTVSLKKGGGSAGHNGLRSIEKHLGSSSFIRFRIGISRPARGGVDSHVLGRFSGDEEALLPLYMEKAAAVLEKIINPDAGSPGISLPEPGSKIILVQ